MKNNRLLYILIVILALWCAMLSSEVQKAKKPGDTNIVNQYEVNGFSTDLTTIVDSVKQGVVTISADGNLLSGFVYRQQGDAVYILSAYHGVSNVSSISVRFGTSYSVEGELVGHDIYTDLALIRIYTPYLIEPLKTGDTSVLKQGEFVISIGTPLSMDYEGSTALSMVAKNNLQIENSILVEDERHNYFLNVVELGSALPSGYSGSPLFNMNGEVVGIMTMSSQSSVSFAVTINEARMIAEQLIGTGSLNRKSFGIRGTFLNDMYSYEKSNLNISIDTVSGFYVERTRENGLAYLSGIRSGDVITRINNEEITDLNSYLRAVYSEAGETVFEYIRNGETLTGILNND